MNLNNLKRQHEDIANIIQEMEQNLNLEYLEKNTFDMSMKLANLSGKILLHLKSEDEFLYPQLMNSNNSELLKTAKKFVVEMGNLSKIFLQYKETYKSSSIIKAQTDSFIKETKTIFTALKNRLNSENQFLYPLIK